MKEETFESWITWIALIGCSSISVMLAVGALFAILCFLKAL